jgi:outer membrane biosynthesis protein TonB
MSLIDEALKRARQEASRQEAAEREKRYARVPVFVAPSRRSRPWLLPVVVTVCLAAGLAGGMLLTRSPHPPAPSAAPSQAPTPAAVATVAENAKPQPAATKPAETTAKKTVDETPVIEEKAPVQPAPTPEKLAIAPHPVPTPAAPPVPIATPSSPSPVIALPQPSPVPSPAPFAPAAPSAPSADVRSYVREVPVADGGTIRLNGIAFSAQPVALFGDKVVAPGESVSGFTVVAIEAQRVKLQGPGGTVVYVTLK